ncbi:6-phosphogluconolactonase [Corynebacterium occultum]|uniref:6-phosphogluconolactonase n=1 Tax=Corynebacterium occultum TaxID=2675219 RepID=A0A6B8W860_9CORY|nr:6-phosphogluconolactonase [Corynebacterium occultum]QGU07475.1 6-phosphogluconolactonase [Corynebacterium occultum]
MVSLARVSDLNELITLASRRFIETITQIQFSGALHGDGLVRVVLTGGGAGIGLLKELARLDAAAEAQSESFPTLRVDWSRVHIFFGDERNVPVSHQDSNEGQARDTLLKHISIPEGNIHGYGLNGQDLDEAAAEYEKTVRRHAPDGFDLHLLGMGGEGHINSLFPHTDAVREKEKLVMAVKDSPKPPAERVTLTMPAINSSGRVWLLVAGAEKASAAAAVMRSAEAVDWPAAGVGGTKETVLFLTDDAATELG